MYYQRLFLILLSVFLINCAANSGKHRSPQANNKASSPKVTDKIFNLPYVMRELDNGLRVIIVPTDFPEVVSVQIPVQTGSRNEFEQGKSGFAHFFEHMMFRGTPNYSSAQYDAMLKNIGADQNAYTTDDYTNYHTTITKDGLETLLMLEADRFQNLKYAEAAFKTEALAVKGEYLKNSANPFSQMQETIRDLAFKKHTYKHTTMGFFEDINDMPNQYEYSHVFFDRWYRPENAAVIIVGDVDAENAYDLVEKYFSSWQKGSFKAQIPAEPPATGQIYKHINWKSQTQPWLVMAFHGPADDPKIKDKKALDLLLQLYFGSTSQTYQELVTNQQLVDQLYAFAPSHKDPELIYIAARLSDEKNFQKVEDAIIATIIKARTQNVDKNKLQDLKSASRYGFATSLDNSATIAAILAQSVQRNRDPELINQQFATLQQVNAKDIKNVANKYLHDTGRIVLTLAHAKEVANFNPDFSLDKLATLANKPQKAAFKVLDLRNNSAIVDLNLLFNTGAAYEDEKKNGLAYLTAKMLSDGGSKYHSITEINNKLFPIAAYFAASVDKEMLSLSGRAPAEKSALWLDLVLESLLEPGFREEDFTRLKQEQINAIKTNLKGNNDEELGKEVLYQQLYQNHPYGTVNLGSISELNNITLEDVKQFYRQQITQHNLTIGVTGQLSDELFTILKEKITQKLAPGTAHQSTVPPAPSLTGHKVTIVEKNTRATAVSFGFPIDLKRGDKDWLALWLVRSYFGEHRNSNSHLYREIREKRGMNYGDYAYIEYFPNGMFRTQPSANLARSSQIFQVWLRPLRSNKDAHFATRTAMYELHHLLKHGMTQEQFTSTRNYLSRYAGLLVKSQDRILGYALDSQFYQTPQWTKYVKQGLAQLSLADVNAAIKKYLQEENIHFVFISKDGKDMKNRLVNEQESVMKYNSPKEKDVLAKDKMLQKYPLGISAKNVQIVPIDKVFE